VIGICGLPSGLTASRAPFLSQNDAVAVELIVPRRLTYQGPVRSGLGQAAPPFGTAVLKG